MPSKIEQVAAPLPVKTIETNGNGVHDTDSLQLEDEDKLDHVLSTFRCLIAGKLNIRTGATKSY